MSDSKPSCHRCKDTDADPYVKDVATDRIYCDRCADALSRICWNRPAVIR